MLPVLKASTTRITDPEVSSATIDEAAVLSAAGFVSVTTHNRALRTFLQIL